MFYTVLEKALGENFSKRTDSFLFLQKPVAIRRSEVFFQVYMVVRPAQQSPEHWRASAKSQQLGVSLCLCPFDLTESERHLARNPGFLTGRVLLQSTVAQHHRARKTLHRGSSCQKRKKKINIRKALISAVNRPLNMLLTIKQ